MTKSKKRSSLEHFTQATDYKLIKALYKPLINTKENMKGKRVKFDTFDGIMTGTIIKVIPGPIHNYYNIQGDNGITYPLEEWQVSFID